VKLKIHAALMANIPLLFMGKSQKTPPQAVGMNSKAGNLGAAAPARAKLAQASYLKKPRRFAPGRFTLEVSTSKS
jgi:hypothetical protein